MNQSCQLSASRKWNWSLPPSFLVTLLHEISPSGTQPFAAGYSYVSVLLFLSSRGNFTVPKLSESNMGFGVLGVFLGLLLEVSTHGPPGMPRTSWRQQGKNELVQNSSQFNKMCLFSFSTYFLTAFEWKWFPGWLKIKFYVPWTICFIPKLTRWWYHAIYLLYY